MALHQLHGSVRSPYTRKVRIVLAEKGIEFEWARDYYAYLQDLNPLGKVPVLVTPAGEAIFDSPVICEYLELFAPDPPLIPGSGLSRLEVMKWEALADGICNAAVAIVNERMRELLAERSDTFIARQRGKIELSIAHASRQHGSRPWCRGNSKSLADIALYTALRYVDFRLPEISWQERHPQLAAWAASLDRLSPFASTAPY